MTTGRASVLVKPNDIQTWDVPIVQPEPGGILVRMVVGGVCGSDLHVVSGETGVIPFPIILGHEGIGRIEALGAGVMKDYVGNDVSQGDLVYWCPISLCHACYTCTVKEAVPCENSTFFEHADKPNWGCYSEYAWLPRGMAFFRVPDDASLDAIAALGCALPSAIGGLERAGGVKVGETVVVQGAGPVGLSLVVLASLAGAKNIIVIDGNESRLRIAASLGATATIAMAGTADERRREIFDICGKAGPDLVIEAAGVMPALTEGLELTGTHGRYLIMGVWGDVGTYPIPVGTFGWKNLTVFGYTFSKPKHYYAALTLATELQDRLPLADLVTHRFNISQAAEAIETVKAGAAVKALIDPSLG